MNNIYIVWDVKCFYYNVATVRNKMKLIGLIANSEQTS